MFVRNKMFVGNNPPFSKNLSSNIARYFPYEHCPKSNLLHRILSKAENVKSAILSASWRKLSQLKAQIKCAIAEPLVNGRSRKKCSKKSVVHKAVIKTKEDGETNE